MDGRRHTARVASLPRDRQELLTSLLKGVSRSFYLTLRILPGSVRAPVSLAYLLARTTDTIADTDALPVADRLQALDRLRRRILKNQPGAHPVIPAREMGGGPAIDLQKFVGPQASAAERQLLERVDDALEVLEGFSPDDQQRVRDVLAIITSGQELDLRRFEGAGPRRVIALVTDQDLEDYTYRVAGCVGEFWTRMSIAHLFPAPPHPDDAKAPAEWFEKSGVRLGKGLQLVNILRDLPRDLQQGRCYIPADALAGAGLSPADLLSASNEARFRPVYNTLLDRAEDYLRDGARYTMALPGRCLRMRLACAWPVLIGLRTLTALRRGAVLDPGQRIKVNRAELRTILLRSVLALPSRSAWRRLLTAAPQAA
jgi:farnesyl-diphosphate farnesyltransferase